MAADRQLLVVGRAGDWAVDVCELAPARLVPGPDLWRGVFGRAAHSYGSRSQRLRHGAIALRRESSLIGALLEDVQCGLALPAPHQSGVRFDSRRARRGRGRRRRGAGRILMRLGRRALNLRDQRSELRPFQRMFTAVCHPQALGFRLRRHQPKLLRTNLPPKRSLKRGKSVDPILIVGAGPTVLCSQSSSLAAACRTS